MKFNELMDRMRKHNEKVDEQYGELMEGDLVESATLDMDVAGWADYFAQRRNEMQSMAKSSKELAAKYAERAKMFEKAADWRSAGLMTLVNMSGKTLKTASGTIYKGQSAATLEIVDETAVPEEYWKTSKSIDKAKLNEDFKKGVEIKGTAIKEGKEFISVKV